MSAASALARARAAGIGLRLGPDGRVVVGARPSAVPPDLLAELREHKAGLAVLLADEAGVTANGDGTAAFDPAPGRRADGPALPASLAEPSGVAVDGDAAALEGVLAAFPGATVDELRLADPFGRLDLQRAFPDADVVPLGTETPADPAVEPWTWSLPLPPRRTRAREPRPGPETIQGRPCRFCGLATDPRETGGDPDGRFSHLECWAAAGRPDVGHAKVGVATAPRGADRCKHCGFPISWKRDGVPFLDGTCAHLACYRRSEDRPDVPSAPPPSVDALAWAQERRQGFTLAVLLKACGRTDVGALVAELRDAGFARDGAEWGEGGP